MKKRPISVTVISWILIVTSSLTLITTLFTLNNPMVRDFMGKSMLPIEIQFILIFVGVTVTLVSGIAMLKGLYWSRLLYAAWGVIGYTIQLVTSPMKTSLIPGFIVFAIMIVFLFRPKANDYFSIKETPGDAQDI